MNPLIEFQLQQLKELTALVVERELLKLAAQDAAEALLRHSEKIEQYLKGLHNG